MATTERTKLSRLTMEYGLRPSAIAGTFVLVAMLWTFPLQRFIAYPFVFLFFGAIMASAWFGGLIAGFMAVVLSSFLIDYFFVPSFLFHLRCKGLTELLRRICCVRHSDHRCELGAQTR